MIQPWLGEVQEGLHGGNEGGIIVNKELCQINTYGNGVKAISVGEFTFITQNPSKDTQWAKLAREGKKVTQVKQGDKWYGVIVDDEVLKYEGWGKEPTVIGKLDINPNVAATVQPSPDIQAALRETLGGEDIPPWEDTAGFPLPPQDYEGVKAEGETLSAIPREEEIPIIVEKLVHGIKTGQIEGDNLEAAKKLMEEAFITHLCHLEK